MSHVFSKFDRPVHPGLECNDEHMTRQEFKDECDINRIMARALKTGTIPGRADMGTYGDFASVGDFQDAQNTIVRAKDQFAALPALVRDRFKNDPGQFLAWIHDKNTTLEEAHEMGLLSAEGVRKVEERKRLKKEAAAKEPPK